LKAFIIDGIISGKSQCFAINIVPKVFLGIGFNMKANAAQ
jgi:hypothetical protein